MPDPSRRPRANSAAMRGRSRAEEVARRLGVSLRDARLATGLLQRDVAVTVGISQPWVSALERGHGAAASVETWALAAAAVGEQLVGFLERAPGADLPRDHQHLQRQSAVIRLAGRGGWRGLPEVEIDTAAARSRSIDVLLARDDHGERAVVEVWDWFDDVGAAMRSLDAKVRMTRRLTEGSAAGARVAGVWIVRDTRRNRALVAGLGALFRAKFPASSTEWLHALTDPGCPMPAEPGFLWSNARANRLIPSRLRA